MSSVCCGSKPPRRPISEILSTSDIMPLAIAGGFFLLVVVVIVDSIFSG